MDCVETQSSMRRILRCAVFFITGISWCQSTPDTSIGGALRSLAARAGVVFVGQVVKIEPKPGVVEVTFRVDRVVQGAVGANYTLKEWAGLWANGQPRYVPGQRAMVFLHAPGVAGLSTPVDGMDGVVPVMPALAGVAPMLNVRWIGTRVERSVGSPLVETMISVEDAVAAVRTAKEPVLVSLPVAAKPHPLAPVRLVPGGGAYSASGVDAASDGEPLAGRRGEIVLQQVVRDER